MTKALVRLALGLALIWIGMKGLDASSIQSAYAQTTDEKEYYPCCAGYGEWTYCGKDSNCGGSCYRPAGTGGSWSQTSEFSCSDGGGYDCHSDGSCGQTANSGASCSLSNAVGKAYYWTCNCPSSESESGACINYHDEDDWLPIQWDDCDAGSSSCD